MSRQSPVASRESDDLETAQVFTTRSDAEIARAKLVGEGIDALVIADDEGGLNPGFFARYGVRVVVRRDRLAAARQALGVPTLHLPSEALDAMTQHARYAAPEEACGLFAVGDDGAVTMVYCLTNSDHSPRSYTIDPAEQFHAWGHARRCGWDIGGVFHSHPDSLPIPSPDDLVGLDPEWVSVIVSPTGLRAYRVRDGVATEVPVERG
jgi:proteasome lid subunit RPN8/RPN11